MNILHVYSIPYPRVRGGVDAVIATLVGEHKRDNHVVIFQAADYNVRRLTRSSNEGVTVYSRRLPFPKCGSTREVLSAILEFLLSGIAVKEVLIRERIEIIHLHTLQFYQLYFVLLGKFLRVPYIVTLHGSETLAYPSRHSVLRFLWRRILRGATCVVTVSSTLADLAKTTFPFLSNIKVIENGIGLSDSTSCNHAVQDLTGGRPYFLTVGSLEENKRHDVVIRAMAKLRGEASRVPLLIVGDGPRRQYYEHLIASLKLDRTVRMLGALPQKTVHSLMAQASAVIMPSQHEGFGLVVAEAGALGRLVICSDIPPFRQITEDCAVLIPVGDEIGIAKAMMQAMEDKTWAKALGGQLQQVIARRFKASVMAEKYSKIYQASCSGFVPDDLLPS